METTNSIAPRKVTDGFDARCSKCGRVMYSEAIVGELVDGKYAYTREVSGSFWQACDAEGNPTGPVVPVCNCKEN